jgi:hypothetical protein
MNSLPRVVACGLGLTLAVWSCSPPCETITPTIGSICHVADAGPIVPNASFVLQGNSGSSSCQVSVDGGTIELKLSATTSCGNADQALRAPAEPVRCTVPALTAGTYTVNSTPAVTFTLPSDGGIAPCN